MDLTPHDRAPTPPRREPICPLSFLSAEHVCADRDGRPIAGTDRTCYYGARVEIIGRTNDVVTAAENVVRSYEARMFGFRPGPA